MQTAAARLWSFPAGARPVRTREPGIRLAPQASLTAGEPPRHPSAHIFLSQLQPSPLPSDARGQ